MHITAVRDIEQTFFNHLSKFQRLACMLVVEFLSVKCPESRQINASNAVPAAIGCARHLESDWQSLTINREILDICGIASTPEADALVALTEIDRDLLRRCLAEEPGAWKDFVDRFIGLFIHVINHTAQARTVRVTSEDVDDLCAEVFLALLAGDYAVLRQFRGESSLATYLAVVARRVVAREIARRRMAEALGHVSAHQASLDQAQADRHESQRIDDREEVERMLEGLPETEAKIVMQYHIEGRTYREISSGLGIPENTIGPTLSRARAKMRSKEVQH